MTTQQLEKTIFQSLGIKFSDDDPVWCDAREILLTGGWRSGKSTRGAGRALRQILRPIKKGLIWLVGPDYIQARQEYLYLRDWTERLGLFVKGTMPSEGQCVLVTKTGWRVETKSGRHSERLGSVAPDGVVMCEPGQVSEEVYEMILGRVAEKRGWIFLCGTLEDDSLHPRWAWYEDLARDWLKNPPGSQTRAFSLPSWANTIVFPGGENDPEITRLRDIYSEYTFKRRIAAEPVGVEHPCFPELWGDSGHIDYFSDLKSQLKQGLQIIDGAIGVDYGTSSEHPSVVVAISVDSLGRHWVRECWFETGGNPDEITYQADRMQRTYDIKKGRTDPQQAVLAMKLGYNIALGGASGGGVPTEARIGIGRGLIEDGYFLFDAGAPKVQDAVTKQLRNSVEYVFTSMRRMRRKRDARGRLGYLRELGDDQAQAVLYALEELRGVDYWVPDIERLGTVKQSWGELPSRTSMVGRV